MLLVLFVFHLINLSIYCAPAISPSFPASRSVPTITAIMVHCLPNSLICHLKFVVILFCLCFSLPHLTHTFVNCCCCCLLTQFCAVLHHSCSSFPLSFVVVDPESTVTPAVIKISTMILFTGASSFRWYQTAGNHLIFSSM